jgi:hypothetical protein
MVHGRVLAATAVLLSIWVSGCATQTWNVQHYPLATASFAARTPPESIQVFRLGGAAVTRAHLEVAQISVRENSLHTPSTSQFSMEAAILEARRKASTLGADAIKELKVYVAPTGTWGSGSVSVDGVAIRWNER